jgi:hypothetical protein
MPHDPWPPLPLDAWRPTYRSLHMWTQVVGKIRMALAPPLNHWWHVALHVSPRGLTTGPIARGLGLLEIEFDFRDGLLRIDAGETGARARPLGAGTVASFYHGILNDLKTLGIGVAISPKPQEVPDPIFFDADHKPCIYDAESARSFWRILVSARNVFERFRGRYIGKSSPAHFFWGSFDLACTRFSGRPAPPRKGVISGPAYSHEVSSVGFWPGGSGIDGPAFYSYTVPQPPGLENAPVRPAAARWHSGLSEFILMYDDVRASPSPEDAVYQFAESTYEAGATLGNWDRAALEI